MVILNYYQVFNLLSVLPDQLRLSQTDIQINVVTIQLLQPPAITNQGLSWLSIQCHTQHSSSHDTQCYTQTPHNTSPAAIQKVADVITDPPSAEVESLVDIAPTWCVGIAQSVRVGPSGDWIPAGVRFSATVQTGSGAHPASSTMGAGSFSGLKRPGSGLDRPLHLTPKLKRE